MIGNLKQKQVFKYIKDKGEYFNITQAVRDLSLPRHLIYYYYKKYLLYEQKD